MRSWPYFGALSLPLALALSLYGGGWWWSIVLAIPFVIVPAIDHLRGPDTSAPSRGEIKEMESQLSYRLVLYLYAVAHVGLIVWGCVVWSTQALALGERVLVILCMGIMTGGLGITIAHELVHRQSVVERWIGYTLLCGVWYMHFGLEHVAGHHKNVGLQEDPATARKGENVYAFVIRSVFKGWAHAFTIERGRLEKVGRSPWSIRNRMFMWVLLQAAWTAAAVVLTGDPTVLVYILGQAGVAILLLELVNYVEHYGLVRREVKPGIIERFGPQHAWESRFPASNYLLFKLQRHADHHLYPQRRYQVLAVHDKSPQLPAGYPVMVLATLIPPLWFRLADPRIP